MWKPRSWGSCPLLSLIALVIATTGCFGHGSYHVELAATDEQLARAPGDGALWLRRSTLNLEHGDWQAALADLEHADRVEPLRYATGWWRGQALAAGGQWAMAKTVLDDFLAAKPEHAGALASRARVLMQLKQPDAALDDYRLALKLTPQAEPNLVDEIATVLAHQQRKEEAVAMLDRHLQRLGHSTGLSVKAMELEVQLGRFEAALSRVAAMQRLAPRAEPWMARRASVLARAGRLQESRSAWADLFAHIQRLPNQERGSHAMQLIAEQATHAIAALNSLTANQTHAQANR